MNKIALVGLIIILALFAALPVDATITTEVKIDDNLFVTYDFESLDQQVYDQAVNEFKAETIPQAIIENFEHQGRTQVEYDFGPQPLVFDNETRAIHASFFLSGSDIISFTSNRTSMKRTYQVRTDWRKFHLDLTSDFPIEFAQHLATPLEDWQKSNATTFYYESEQTDAPAIAFYLSLPPSASDIRVGNDIIFYDILPNLGDQLLNSPFLILGALAVLLIIALIYRKAR